MTVSPPAKFRVLSLDGGGIRGAFIAGFLSRIERQLGKCIGTYFDLVVGTSTGGIVAAAIAFERSLADVSKFYQDRGPDIFRTPQKGRILERLAIRLTRILFPSFQLSSLTRSKYASEPLRQALTDFFETVTLKDAKHSLALPSFDLITGKTVVFKTPHQSEYFRDGPTQVVDALMATTAAPLYFPPAGWKAGQGYCDGGVWANNPAMVAIAEAKTILQSRGQSDRETVVLSVGTGQHQVFKQLKGEKTGLLGWGEDLLNVVNASQSQGFTNLATILLKDRFFRVDFDLPNQSWALDSVGVVDELIHRGEEVAVARFQELRPHFFNDGEDMAIK